VQIKVNKSLTLSGEAKATLHLHQDADHRTHIPRPEIVPHNQVIKQQELLAAIFSNNPNEPHQKETFLPQDVAKVGRKLAIMPKGSPEGEKPKPEQYHLLDSIGSTIYDLVFTTEQKGATAFLITWYENARGEHGPESEPLSFLII
jgi:hypothetical protein